MREFMPNKTKELIIYLIYEEVDDNAEATLSLQD